MGPDFRALTRSWEYQQSVLNEVKVLTLAEANRFHGTKHRVRDPEKRLAVSENVIETNPANLAFGSKRIKHLHVPSIIGWPRDSNTT